jgi:hypothetical protein
VGEKSTLRSNSWKMTEKSLSSSPSLKELHTSYTTSWPTTPSKSEKLLFPTPARIHSLSPSRGKSFPDNSPSINLDRPMLKILLKLMRFAWEAAYRCLAVPTSSKVVTSSPETTMQLNTAYKCHLPRTTQLRESNQDQVTFLLCRYHYSSS